MAVGVNDRVGLPRWLIVSLIPFALALAFFALRSFVTETGRSTAGDVEGDINEIRKAQVEILRSVDGVQRDVNYIRRDVDEMRQFRQTIDDRLRQMEQNRGNRLR